MFQSSPLPVSVPAPLIEFKNVRFAYAERVILDGVSLQIPRGKVTALMGASGGGKTTLMRLIGAQHTAQQGQVLVRGQDVAQLAQPELYALRRKMGLLFQFGALFSDLSVLDNVAFPLREHTALAPEQVRDIALMKLHAVGLRGAQALMPSEISGGMARRVALARAMALDPEIMMYDEPFAGLDPIALGTAARLIRQLNDTLGLTSIIISHDIEETFAIADQVIVLANGRIAAQGTPAEVRNSTDPLVHQFVHAEPDGPVRFHYPAPSLAADFGLTLADDEVVVAQTQPVSGVSDLALNRLGQIGALTRHTLADWGYGAKLFAVLLALPHLAFRRWALLRDQIHFLGNYSLSIVGISGLFVGFVLALQGYYTLQRYGSSEALGLLVALSLVRELGPVVTALLFAGRAGTALTAEIGLMKRDEVLAYMEMSAIDPVRRILLPRFWGGVIAMPLLAAVFSAVGVVGAWLVGVVMIGIDPGSFWSNMQNGVDLARDVGNGVLKSLIFGLAVSFVALLQGHQAQPTPEGVSRATTRTVVVASLAVLGLDFVLTALMFSI
jgi:phospholipid/cholesterol/gamma-HCH transport system ATP-binding protein